MKWRPGRRLGNGIRAVVVVACLLGVMSGLVVSSALAGDGQAQDSVLSFIPPANLFDDCVAEYCVPAYDACIQALCQPLTSGCGVPCETIYTTSGSACEGACRNYQNHPECVEPYMGSFLGCCSGCWTSAVFGDCGHACLGSLEASMAACLEVGEASPTATAPPSPLPSPTATPSTPRIPTATRLPSATPTPPVDQCAQVTLSPLPDEGGVVYTGVAADGVSELRFSACFPRVTVSRSVTCRNLNTGDSVECQAGLTCVSEATGQRVPCGALDDAVGSWTVTFRPPEVFDEPYTLEIVAKASSPVASAHPVSAPPQQAQQASVQRQVHRTPVVLIHGIWGSQESVRPVLLYLYGTGQFVELKTAWYKPTNDDMRGYVGVLSKLVGDILSLVQARNIKAQRVDIVAHSMGGLISRLYIAGYTDVWGQQVPGHAAKVRKLITLATPHKGTPFADWYYGIAWEVSSGASHTRLDGTLTQLQITQPNVDEVVEAVRKKKGLDPPGLEYGKAVEQMRPSSPTGPNPLLDDLAAREGALQVTIQRYTIAGDKPFLSSDETKELLDTLSSWGAWASESGGFREVATELVGFASQQDTDGVVPTDSALARNTHLVLLGNKTVPEDHFSITGNPAVHYQVFDWLTDGIKPPKGTTAVTRSPGHLHIYGPDGEHVGLDPSGQIEIGIDGGVYESFNDVTGDHEFVWIPETTGVTVQFVADEEGTVGLDVSQSLDDGLHWFGYEDIEIRSGSVVTIRTDPKSPRAQTVHATGETVELSPTYSELPGPAGVRPTPESPEQGGTGALTGLLLAISCAGVVGVAILVVALILARSRGARVIIIVLILGGAGITALACCLGGVLLMGAEEASPEATPAGVSMHTVVALEPATTTLPPTETPGQPPSPTSAVGAITTRVPEPRETPAPVALAPDEIMSTSAERMKQITTASILFSQLGPGTSFANGVGEVLLPNSARVDKTSSLDEEAVETIIIGSTGYWEDDTAPGGWNMGPIAPFSSNPANWLELSQFYSNATSLGDEEVNGVECYHVEFAVTIPAGWLGLSSGGGSGEAWISKSDYSVVKAMYDVEYEGSREGGDMILTLELWEFNEPVTIVAPR
jgi:pimeloyl-ACP methyl ester carboxylesterase